MKRKFQNLASWMIDHARLATAPSGRRIGLVCDSSGWSISWDHYHLYREMRSLKRVSVRKLHQPMSPRHCLVHALNRYALLGLDPGRIHGSNRLILTWYHGSPASSDFEPLYASLQGWLGRLSAIVTTCQISVADLIAGGVPASLIRVVPLGVDSMTFFTPTAEQRLVARRAWGVEPDEVVIGSFQKDGVGWGDGCIPKHVKGPDIFIDVIARLRRAEPKVRLKVLLTGPARGYVKDGLDKMGVSYVHRYLNHPRQVAEAYRALDMYLVTSRCEGGPKALLEAWASGTPLVSTRVGMVSDLVESGVTGMIAEVDDVGTLVESCRRLIHDPEHRQQCVRHAATETLKYTWHCNAVQHYERVYSPILNRPDP